MAEYRIAQVAALLGVSDDAVRRWVEDGQLPLRPGRGPKTISGEDLVAFLQNSKAWQLFDAANSSTHSTRNQLSGIITRIISDRVMSQIELQCGRYRVVSLISTEAVKELGLAVGDIATAQVKATNVSIIKQ